MGRVIDGKALAAVVREEVRGRVGELAARGVVPRLVVVMVGDDPGSLSYVRGKEKACAAVGIAGETVRLPASAGEAELLDTVDRLNSDHSVHGLLVQLPLPGQMDVERVVNAISPLKDVDCFHPENLGRLFRGRPRFAPCTPAGIVRILKSVPVKLEGANVVVLGRSLIVGRPLAFLLLSEHATVTVCHTRTRNLAEVVSRADIVVASVGKPRLVPAEWVREGAVVVDVGVNAVEGGKLVGDVDFDSVSRKASYITPVPGGVGPMTVAMLLKNVVGAAELQSSSGTASIT